MHLTARDHYRANGPTERLKTVPSWAELAQDQDEVSRPRSWLLS